MKPDYKVAVNIVLETNHELKMALVFYKYETDKNQTS